MGSKKPGQGVLFGTMSIFAVGTYYVNEASFVGLIQKEQGDAAQNSIIKARGLTNNKPKSLIDSLSGSFFGGNRELTFSDWITTPEAVNAYEKWRLSEAGVRFLTEPYVNTPYYKTNLLKWSSRQKRPFKEFFRISRNKSSYQNLFNDWKVQRSGFQYLKSEYEKTDEFNEAMDEWVKNGPGMMDIKTFFTLRDREPQYRSDYDDWKIKRDNVDKLLTLWKTKKDYDDKKKLWLDDRNKKQDQDEWVLTPDATSYYQSWKTGTSYQGDTEIGWKKTPNYKTVLKTWVDVYPTKKSLDDYKDQKTLWTTYFTNYKNSRAGNLEIEDKIKEHTTYVSRKRTWSPTGKTTWLSSRDSNRFYNAWRTSVPGQRILKPLFEATAKYQEEKNEWIVSSYTNKQSKDLWLAGLGSTAPYNTWKVTPGAVRKLQTKWIGDDDGDYVAKRNSWIRDNYNKRAKSVWATLDDATTKFNQWKALAANQNKLKTNWETTADFTRKMNAWIDGNPIKRSKATWLGLDDARAKYNRWRVSTRGHNLLKPIFNNLPVYVTARNRWLLSDKFTSKTPKNQWFTRDKDGLLAKYNAWKATDAGKVALTTLFHTKQSYITKKNAWLRDTTLNTKKRAKSYWKTTKDADDNWKAWHQTHKNRDLRSRHDRYTMSEAKYYEQYGKAVFDKKYEEWKKNTKKVPKISTWAKNRGYYEDSFNEWKRELKVNNDQTKRDKNQVEAFWKREYIDAAANLYASKKWRDWVEEYRGDKTKKLTNWQKVTWPNPEKSSLPLPTYDQIRKKYGWIHYGLDYKTWVPDVAMENWGEKVHKRDIYVGYDKYLGDFEISARHWREKNYDLLKTLWDTPQRKRDWAKSNLKIFTYDDWIGEGKNDLIAKYNAWKTTPQGQNYLFEEYKKTAFYKAKIKTWFDTHKTRKARADWQISPEAKVAFGEWTPTATQKQDLEQTWKASDDYTAKKNAWVNRGSAKRSFTTWIEGTFSDAPFTTWRDEDKNTPFVKTEWEKSIAFTNQANQWFVAQKPDLDTKTKWLNSPSSNDHILAFVEDHKNREVLQKFENSDAYDEDESSDVDGWLMSSFSPLKTWVENNLNSDQIIANKRYNWSFKKMERVWGHVHGFNIKIQGFKENVKNKSYSTTNKTLKKVLYDLAHRYLDLNLKWKEKKVTRLSFHNNARYLEKLKNTYEKNQQEYGKVWANKILGYKGYTDINSDLKKYLVQIYKDYSGVNPATNDDFKLYQKHLFGKRSNYVKNFKTWLKNGGNQEIIDLGNNIYASYQKDELKGDVTKYNELFTTWKNSDGKAVYKLSDKAKQDYNNWNDANPITTRDDNYDTNYQYQLDLKDYEFTYYLTTPEATTSYNSWIDQDAVREYERSNQIQNDFQGWLNNYQENDVFQNGILAYLDSAKANQDWQQWTNKITDDLIDNFSNKDQRFYDYYFADEYGLRSHHGYERRGLRETSYSGSKKIKLNFIYMSRTRTNQNLLDTFENNTSYWQPYWKSYHNRQNEKISKAKAVKYYKDNRNEWIKDFNKWFASNFNKRQYWVRDYNNPHSPMKRHYKKWVDEGGKGTYSKDVANYRRKTQYIDDVKQWLNAKKVGTDKTNWFWFYVDLSTAGSLQYFEWPDPIGEDDYHQTKQYKDDVKAFIDGAILRGDDEKLGAYLTSDQSNTDYNAWIDLSGENQYQASDEYINDLNAWSLNADASFNLFSGDISNADYAAWNDPNPIRKTQVQYKNSDDYTTDFTAWKEVSDDDGKTNDFKFYLTQRESTTHYNSWFDPIGETRYKASAIFTRDYNAWETKGKGVGVYKDDPQSDVDYGAWIDPGGEGSYKASAAFLSDLNAWSSDKSKGIGSYTTATKSNEDWSTILDEEFAKTRIHTGLMTSLKASESESIYTASDRFKTDYDLWVDPLLRSEAKYLLTPEFKTNARGYYNTDARVFSLYQTTKTFDDDYNDWLGVTFVERDYLADDISKNHLALWSNVFKNGEELYAQSKLPQDDLAKFNLERKRTDVKYLDSDDHFNSYKEYIVTTRQTYYDVWFYTAKFGENIYRTWDDPKGIDPDDEKYQVSEDYWKNLGVWSKNIVNGRSQFEKSPLGIHLFVNYKFKKRN